MEEILEMKLSNVGIIFVLVFLCIVVGMDAKEQTLVGITNQKIKLDQQLDNAVDDAMSVLIEMNSKNKIIINHEKSVRLFYKSLESNLGILDNKLKRDILRVYIPFVLITTTDGFYINYNRIEDGVFINTWTEKIPYVSKENGIVYKFFAGEEKENICVLENNKIYRGKWNELGISYPERITKDFEQYRRNAIIKCITDKMQYYINQNNYIAKEFGISYSFYLPNIKSDDWNRTIDDISFFTIFQGYPYGNMTYNRYTVSGARTHKEDMLYVQYDKSMGKKLYHRYECEKLKDFSNGYFTKKQCAKEGAFSCPYCKP